MKAVCHTAIGHEGIHQNSFWWCHAKALHNVAHNYQASTPETSWNKNVKGSSRSSQCPKILCCICGTTMGYQQAQQVPVQSHANNLHFSLKWGLPTRCFLLIQTLAPIKFFELKLLVAICISRIENFFICPRLDSRLSSGAYPASPIPVGWQ